MNFQISDELFGIDSTNRLVSFAIFTETSVSILKISGPQYHKVLEIKWINHDHE